MKFLQELLQEAKEAEVDYDLGDEVKITGRVAFKGKTGVVDSFGKDKKFVVVDLFGEGKHSFHSSDVSAHQAEEDEVEQHEFFVVFYDKEDNHTWVGSVAMGEDGKWHESTVAGRADHKWGGPNYMGYLKPQDIMSWIHRDYANGMEIEGPFDTKKEALDRAKTHFGNVLGALKEGVKKTPWELLNKIAKDKNQFAFGALQMADAQQYVDFKKADLLASKTGDKNFWSLDEIYMKALVNKYPDVLKGEAKRQYEGLSEAVIKDVEQWKAAVKKAYPDIAAKLKFKGRSEGDKDIISAELPGEDRLYGVFDIDKEEGEVLGEAYTPPGIGPLRKAPRPSQGTFVKRPPYVKPERPQPFKPKSIVIVKKTGEKREVVGKNGDGTIETVALDAKLLSKEAMAKMTVVPGMSHASYMPRELELKTPGNTGERDDSDFL